MNSTNKRKCRLKVVASKRHNSSGSRSRSLSLSKRGKISGNSKYRITTLLKNNKNLALALQDAKGELSVKQIRLENAAKLFENIMQARVLMSGMFSDLKSFVEKFDDALSLLNVDNIKISDICVPFKSCGQFKSKVKGLAESVQQVLEENSFSVMAENVNSDINMTEAPNQIIPKDDNSSIDSNAMEGTDKCVDKQTTNFEAEHCLPLKVSIENTSTFNEIILDAFDSRPPVEFCENFEEAVDPSVGKATSPTKNDTLKNRESSGTPKLSIVSINTLKNSGVLPNYKASVSFKVPSSPDKVITDVLNAHASSSKVKSSKIPRLNNLFTSSKVELNLPGNVLKQSDISSQKTSKITENSDLDMARRKTFVVKDTDTLATNSESNSTSSVHEIRNENDFTAAESRQTNSRKTFVIKVKDSPKDERKSISNRRKTFVKKKHTTNNKIPKCMENRRETFVISETKEDCNNENVTTVTENSTSNDLGKNKCLLSEGKLFEKLPAVCDKTSEITTFQESLDNKDIPSKIIYCKNQSEQIPFQCKNIVSETNKTTLEQELKLDSNCDKENLCKAMNVNKRSPGDTIEPSNICATSEECVQSVMSNDIGSIDIKDNKRDSRSKKPVSYKLFLESSDSEVEIIPKLDISFVKEPSDKPIPIRKRISRSQKKKVFVFSAHKEKSIQSKKSLSKVKKKSVKHVDFVQELNCVSHSDNTNIKNKDVITEVSECQGNEKIMECVSDDFTCDMSSSNKNGIEYCKTSANNQEILQSAVTGGKDSDISRSAPNEKLFVFSAHKGKSIQSKKSLSKVKKKSVKHVDFVQELNCVSHSDNTNIKNKDVITEVAECQGNEKIMECVSDDFTCDMSCSNKNGIEYCKTSANNQEILQSAVTGGKDSDSSRSAPNEKLSASKSGENGIKNSLSVFNSPVIVSHKFLNAIESDKDLDCEKGQGNMICETKTKSRKKYSKSSKSNQVINNPLKDYSVDSISVQKSSKRNDSKKQSEQTITAHVQETNESNMLLQNENQEKQTKKKNKTKSTKNRKKSPASMSNDNTIVVQAQVHSPPQEYDTISKTRGSNKENKSKLESENCLVLLNDIFKPTNIDILSLSCKNNMDFNDRNIPLKIPLSDNSCNIPPSVGDSHNSKDEERIATDVEGTTHRKRAKKVNYSEPSLRKKLRQ